MNFTKVAFCFIFLASLLCSQTINGIPNQSLPTTVQTNITQPQALNGPVGQPSLTVSTLPSASANNGVSYWVKDGATMFDCSVGVGSYRVACTSNGTSWMPDSIGARLHPGVGLASLIAGGLRHIVACCDSLTEGSPSQNTYLNYLAPALRAAYGDGGPGYIPFDYTAVSTVYSGTGYSTGGTNSPTHLINMVDGNNNPTGVALYSFNRQGESWASTTGTEFINLNPHRNWDTAKVFYLLQPGGGSARCYSGTGTVVTFSTNAAAYGLGSMVITPRKVYGTLASISSNITCDQLGASTTTNGSGVAAILNGPVTLFGVYEQVNNNGVQISEIARGGQTLTSYASLNSTFQQQWYSNYSSTTNSGGVGPLFLLLDGGMNDRNTYTASQLQTSAQNMLNSVLSNSANGMLLIDPHDPADYASGNMPAYHTMFRTLAATNRIAFTSDRQLFGTYTQASANPSLMNGDGIHPSSLGNQMRAISYLSALGVPFGQPINTAYIPASAVPMARLADPIIYGTVQTGPHTWLGEISASTGNQQTGLPDATTCPDLVLKYVKTDNSANTVTLNAASGQNINGSSTYVLSTQWQTVTLTSDGANWIAN